MERPINYTYRIQTHRKSQIIEATDADHAVKEFNGSADLKEFFAAVTKGGQYAWIDSPDDPKLPKPMVKQGTSKD